MNKIKLSPPFLIQMCSGEKNQQCDILVHGSFHEVQKDENGSLWLANKTDCIPNEYKTVIVSEKPETKQCPSCKNEFPIDWAFSEWREKNVEHVSCVRCYERKYVPHSNGYSRDDYRQTLREELKKEMGF